MTTRDELREFLSWAKPMHTHMLVVCDTFSHEDYPVFVAEHRSVKREIAESSTGMSRVMEVYDLRQPIEPQLAAERAWNV